MASYEEDAIPADLQEKAKKVTFKFCRECSNMLYPQEDNTNSRLMFTCRNCTYSEAADSACVYRNALKEEVAETAGNVDDVAEDPTVGDVDMDDIYGGDPFMDVEVAGEDVIPDLCTLCGNEIVCPQRDQPTDHFMALQADDPAAALHDPQKEEEQVEAERRERALSGAAAGPRIPTM